jgi:hypothetical protein
MLMPLSPFFDSPHCQSLTNALLMLYAATFTWQTADDGPALLRIHAGGSICQATILPT